MTNRKILDVTALSSDLSDSRILRVHFRKSATCLDRHELLEAINLKIAEVIGHGEKPRTRCAECDCGDGPCNWIAPAPT